MAETLTAAQLEVLKLLQFETSEDELFELKKILSVYLADRLMRSINTEIEINQYTKEQTDIWANEHFRIAYQVNRAK